MNGNHSFVRKLKKKIIFIIFFFCYSWTICICSFHIEKAHSNNENRWNVTWTEIYFFIFFVFLFLWIIYKIFTFHSLAYLLKMLKSFLSLFFFLKKKSQISNFNCFEINQMRETKKQIFFFLEMKFNISLLFAIHPFNEKELLCLSIRFQTGKNGKKKFVRSYVFFFLLRFTCRKMERKKFSVGENVKRKSKRDEHIFSSKRQIENILCYWIKKYILFIILHQWMCEWDK